MGCCMVKSSPSHQTIPLMATHAIVTDRSNCCPLPPGARRDAGTPPKRTRVPKSSHSVPTDQGRHCPVHTTLKIRLVTEGLERWQLWMIGRPGAEERPAPSVGASEFVGVVVAVRSG